MNDAALLRQVDFNVGDPPARLAAAMRMPNRCCRSAMAAGAVTLFL